MSNYTFRAALKEDMPHLFNLIKDLAEFERMPEQVKITPEMLIQDGFGENPAFGCFVATPKEDNNKLIGYALYYKCYSSWIGKSIFLEDLFVHPEYRKLGIGKNLFIKVAELAYNTSKRVDLHVLSWNPAQTFYKSLGCIDLTLKEKWHTYRIDNEALNKLIETHRKQ